MPSLHRYPATVGLLALLLGVAVLPATAVPLSYRGKATDQAFGALLSMPTAEPAEGRWIIPLPADFAPGDESELIAYLNKKKRAGADFNDRRHFGTLLQHALRARLGKTAAWLLENGGDPHAVAGGGDNALALARRFQLDDIAALLIERHGLRDPLRPVAAAAPAVAPGAAQIATAMYLDLLKAKQDAVQLREFRTEMLAALKALSANDRNQVLDHDQAVRALVAASAFDVAQLTEALELIPPVRGEAALGAVLDGMMSATTLGPHKDVPPPWPPIAAWRLLWERYGTPLDYRRSRSAAYGYLLAAFPAEHVDELLASGYAALGVDQALGCQLSEMSAAELEARWPLLSKHFPDLLQQAPNRVLDHFRIGGKCWAWKDEETLGKLRLLQRLGSEGRVSGLIPHSLADKPPALLEAINAFRAPPPDLSAPRLRAVAPRCRPPLSASMFQRLLNSPRIGEDPVVAVDSVQWIELTGKDTCALLVAGKETVDPYRPGDYDSFDGPYTDPRPSCPDPQDDFEVWWEDPQGRLQRINSELESGLLLSSLSLVEDGQDGPRYYLSSVPPVWNCSPKARLPELLRLQTTASGQQLVRAVLTPDTQHVLLDQCLFAEDGSELVCAGIASSQDTNGGAASFAPQALADLLDRWPADDAASSESTLREHYLAAVMALDRPRLKALMNKGVPVHWTQASMLAVSDSDLPLADKRKRIAWLFHDHAQLAKAMDWWVVERLRPWLPLEDWGPVLKLIRANPSIWNQPLVPAPDTDNAVVLSRLDCALQHAQQQLCGGGWRID